MKAKKAVKQLERRLRDEPENLALRVKLAGALRDAGRTHDAIAMYRAVALAYQGQGRISQAAAVCRSALEIEPQQPDTLELLRQLEAVRSSQREAEPTTIRSDRHSLPSLSGARSSVARVRSSEVAPVRRSPRPSGSGGVDPEPRKRYTRPSNEPRRRRPSAQQIPRQTASRPPGVPGPPGEASRPTAPTGERRRGSPLPPAGTPSRPAGGPPLPPAGTPSRPTGRPPPLPPRARSLPDVPVPAAPEGGDEFDDAATRVAGEAGGPAHAPPGAGQPAAEARPTDAIEDGERTIAHESPGSAGDAEVMTQVFDRSFQPTLDSLAPDGSAIDVPLGVFADLPKDVLDQLVRGMSLRTAEPGEVLVREGEIGDACFVIASGEVRVLKRAPTDPHGELLEVARLGHGAVFGEFALLADRRRHATVEVLKPAELFEIPRRLASELAASYPDVRPALERFYRERLLSTLLSTTPLFRPLPAERRAEILSHFHPQRSESGEAIVREGEHAGGLYLIVLGQVEITKRVAQHRSVLLATLGEGAYFGEMSLLHGEPASASVVATGPSELAVLPARAFYDLVADYPVLWNAMKREVGRRDLETHRIVAGNTSVV